MKWNLLHYTTDRRDCHREKIQVLCKVVGLFQRVTGGQTVAGPGRIDGGPGLQLEVTAVIPGGAGLFPIEGDLQGGEHHIDQVADIGHILRAAPVPGKIAEGTDPGQIDGRVLRRGGQGLGDEAAGIPGGIGGVFLILLPEQAVDQPGLSQKPACQPGQKAGDPGEIALIALGGEKAPLLQGHAIAGPAHLAHGHEHKGPGEIAGAAASAAADIGKVFQKIGLIAGPDLFQQPGITLTGCGLQLSGDLLQKAVHGFFQLGFGFGIIGMHRSSSSKQENDAAGSPCPLQKAPLCIRLYHRARKRS